jgi:protein-disulfide isomerase-like protein with CxxC motif
VKKMAKAKAPFVLIGVNSDSSLEVAREAVEKNQLTWRSFFDSQGKIARKWDIQGWPTIILIDQKGVLRFRNHYLNEKLLERLVKEAQEDQRVKDPKKKH